jgi:PAS domain S-box-containing protein
MALDNVVNRLKQADINKYNLYAVINNIADSVWSFDPEYKLIAANKAFHQTRMAIYGKTISIGDNIFTNTTKPAYDKWQPLYQRALSGEYIAFEEMRLVNNAEMHVEIIISPVYDDDSELIGCMGITRNITERKKAEEVILAHTKKLEEYAFKTSHELRHPITNIMALAELFMIEGMSADEKEEVVGLMLIAAENLDNTIQRMIQSIRK